MDKREKLIEMIEDYVKSENLSEMDMIKLTRNLTLDILNRKYKDAGSTQVFKRSGKLEGFSSEKLYNSIARSSDDSTMKMNESDINFIISQLERSIKESGDHVLCSFAIRDSVTDILNVNGFGQVAKSYNKKIKKF